MKDAFLFAFKLRINVFNTLYISWKSYVCLDYIFLKRCENACKDTEV